MDTVLSQCTLTARKDHVCGACEYLVNLGFNGVGLSFKQLREVVKAKRNNWRIAKGQKYLKVTGIYDGSFFTFKAIPEIDEICKSLDYYRE